MDNNENLEQLLLELAALAQTLEGIEKRRQELLTELTEAEQLARFSDDYRQVMNTMAAHPYGYHGQAQRLELSKYWSKTKDDIVYTHGDLAYHGRSGMCYYYITGTDGMKAGHRANVKKVYGLDFAENEAPSYRTMHEINTPYVVIADDHKTAQGVWGDIGFVTSMQADGSSMGEAGLSRYSGEFINEDGQWKLWHRADYSDIRLTSYDRYSLRGGEIGGKVAIEDEFPFKAEDQKALGIKTIEQLEDRGGYDNWVVSRFEPVLPDPYETWADDQSFIQVVNDGYDLGNISFQG